MIAEVDLTHVPYRGAGPALVDLLGGQVDVYFAGMASSVDHLKTGKLRALGVTTTTRFGSLPDLPSIGEFVPGYEASDWFGLGAPKGTPQEIVGALSAQVAAGLQYEKLKLRIAALGGTVAQGSPADFGKFISDETAKWAKVIKIAGIKLD
jgi:tripartite-type tricarboxylate transporter receptor subunit TctC